MPESPKFEVHFLSSGSTGNCTLVRTHGGAFLIDFGLGPGRLLELLRPCGIHATYSRERSKGRGPAFSGPTEPLRAAVVTHTHGDHFSPTSLKLLLENNVHLHIHREHAMALGELAAFRNLRERNLVSYYADKSFEILDRVTANPIRLPHDSDATHGFVFENRGQRFGYAADLGHATRHLIESLQGCDLLALEFNHDEEMERTSGRHPRHISRVLGTHGHLSNKQAAGALRSILQSDANRLRHLALLHLSADCNCPKLAEKTARSVLQEIGATAEVLVTRQREYAGSVSLTEPPAHPAPRRRVVTLECAQGGRRVLEETEMFALDTP